MNRATLLGNLGQDAEIRYNQKGNAILTFSIATKDRRGEETVVVWHDCVAYGNYVVDLHPIMKKGCQVFIDGKIWKREWKDKDQNPRVATEIIANIVRVIQRTNIRSPQPDDLPL